MSVGSGAHIGLALSFSSFEQRPGAQGPDQRNAHPGGDESVTDLSVIGGREVICPIPFSSSAAILEKSLDHSWQRSNKKKRGKRMIRDSLWRLGLLIGVLVSLWPFLFPFLARTGIVPTLSPANIGAGVLFLVPFGLVEPLMVVCLCFRRTRPLSFGLAVGLLVLQIGVLLLTLHLGPLVAFLLNLPGSLPLLIVAMAFSVNRVRLSRKRFNTLESFHEPER
jgi:hypothetical protein